MSRLLQFCKGCGEEKVLRRVTIEIDNIPKNIDLCQECLTVLMLNNITATLGIVLKKVSDGPCPGDCQELKKSFDVRACPHCTRNPTLKDYYRQDLLSPEIKKEDKK